MTIIFLQPLLGIITFVVGLIVWFLYIKALNHSQPIGFWDDLEKVFGKQKWYFNLNITFVFILLVLFSLIIADPHLKNQKKKIVKNGIDIAIVLDLSYSMLAEDIKPNRLEVAKKVISDFTSQLSTDRVWLVLFSGKPFTSVPLTFDYDFITQYVKDITIDAINQDYSHLQWTAIWDGLLYGAWLFDENDERKKVIVLLTDGEANRGIDPLQALKYVKDKNIQVDSVGIGWDVDTYVTIRNIYGTQRLAVGWIDEQNLQAIADSTWGTYYRADSIETFQKLFEALNLLDKNEIQVEVYQDITAFYDVFYWGVFFLFTAFVSLNLVYFLRK